MAKRAIAVTLAFEAALGMALVAMSLQIVRLGGERSLEVPAPREELVAMDRSGAIIQSLSLEGSWTAPRLSPDGTRVLAVRERVGRGDIWLLSLAGAAKQQLTDSGGRASFPAWSYDGLSFTYVLWNRFEFEVRRRELATGHDTCAIQGEHLMIPEDASRNGPLLLLAEFLGKETWKLVTGAPRDHLNWRRLLPNDVNGYEARFSPSGRFLAYTAPTWDRDDVYVSTLKGHSYGKPVRVSPAGGFGPEWTKAGNELFYIDPEGWLIVTKWNETGQAEPARRMFRLSDAVPGYYYRFGGYSVDMQGQRFFAILEEYGNPGQRFNAAPTKKSEGRHL